MELSRFRGDLLPKDLPGRGTGRDDQVTFSWTGIDDINDTSPSLRSKSHFRHPASLKSEFHHFCSLNY